MTSELAIYFNYMGCADWDLWYLNNANRIFRVHSVTFLHRNASCHYV